MSAITLDKMMNFKKWHLFERKIGFSPKKCVEHSSLM